MASKKSKMGTADYMRPDLRVKRDLAAKKASKTAAAGTLKSSNVSNYAARKRETEAQMRKTISQAKRKK